MFLIAFGAMYMWRRHEAEQKTRCMQGEAHPRLPRQDCLGPWPRTCWAAARAALPQSPVDASCDSTLSQLAFRLGGGGGGGAAMKQGAGP